MLEHEGQIVMAQSISHPPGSAPNDALANGKPPTETRSVHLRGVPEAIWRRARADAVLAGMSFKKYVINLLAHGAEKALDHDTAAASPVAPSRSSNPEG